MVTTQREPFWRTSTERHRPSPVFASERLTRSSPEEDDWAETDADWLSPVDGELVDVELDFADAEAPRGRLDRGICLSVRLPSAR